MKIKTITELRKERMKIYEKRKKELQGAFYKKPKKEKENANRPNL